jgi:formyl-CoA transferase
VIDVDLVDSVFSLMEGMLPEYALDGPVRQPVGAAIATASPTNTYPCEDGKWLCVAGNSDLIFARLMEAIGQPDLAADPAYATNVPRCKNREPLDTAIAAWTRAVPAKEAERVLERADVPCSRLYDIADCATAPLIGPTLHPGPVIRMDGEAPEDVVRWTGPAAGAHTDFVLDTLLGMPRGVRPKSV